MTARRRKAWPATLAAVLLGLQATLLAFSLGASAAPAPRDQFGNILCATAVPGAEHGVPSEPRDRHGGRLDCCTAGCPTAGGGSAPAEAAAIPVARPVVVEVRFALRENAGGAAVPSSPRQPRAPPIPFV